MSLHTWLLCAATAFIGCAIPGPNMLLMITHGAWHGLRGTIPTMVGCLFSLLLMLVISAAGLGVVLQAWPAMFSTLRVVGAAYLIWLGVKAWRAPLARPADADVAARSGAAPHATDGAPARGAASRWSQVRHGFLVGSSNPKAVLFCAALLTQFIDASRPTLPQLSVLVTTVAVFEVSWYVVYATFGTHIGSRLKRPKFMKAFNRLTGGIFVSFGAAMALLVRH
ncbi:MAG TPA: LysE family translocator [Paraburkholderia sp.]|jgi:threonine/homoserine/homoserine lactone efflux protein|nr:LysE family translocator [Paraburkholderia sp.]